MRKIKAIRLRWLGYVLRNPLKEELTECCTAPPLDEVDSENTRGKDVWIMWKTI